MRSQSKIQIPIKGKIIGGHRPLICLPLMAATPSALLEQARTMTALKPDMIEWRVDAFDTLTDQQSVKAALTILADICRSLPLLFTCRAADEGGMQALNSAERLALYRMAVASGIVDLIDIELASGTAIIDELQHACAAAGIKLILSYHNFNDTPDVRTLLQILTNAEKSGADIAKIAVMPKKNQDVLTLLNAACEARSRHLNIPIVAISMGAAGVITRIAGGLFGSDITFASGPQVTAPGQLSVEKLRKAWSVFPWEDEPAG